MDSTVTGWEGTPFLGGEKWMFCWLAESTPIHWKFIPVGKRDAGKFTAFGMLTGVANSRFMTQAPSPRLRPGQRKSRRNIRSIKKGNRHRSLVRTGEVKAPLASGSYSVAENSKPKTTRHYLKYEVLSVSLAHGFSFEQRIISMKNKQINKSHRKEILCMHKCKSE